MPIELSWKKILTGALAVTLVTGSGSAVLSSPIAVHAAAITASTPFLDVNAGHWAEKHIAKLYFQGIIDGYKNTADGSSTFKPEKSVSQQEAVLMALRFAGLIDKAPTNSMIIFDQSFEVSEFFKSYIELAFTEGLLDREEEYALAKADTENAWGSKPASREWVTKLIVKAIGQQAVANQLQNAGSHFQDASSISTRYKGFVNAAFQLGLVKGMTETTFEPAKTITRASLATLFSRAQSSYPVDYEGQLSGVISDLTPTGLTVHQDGKETTYTLDSSTVYFHFNSEKPITKDQLLEYGDVTVIGKDGVAQYVEVESDTQHTKTVSGTFDRFNAADKTFYVWIDNKAQLFSYDESLLVEDAEGKTVAIDTIRRDAKVTIVQDSFRKEPRTLKLTTAVAPNTTTISGMVQNLDKESITILQDGKTLVSKFLDKSVTVQIEGLPNTSVNDLIAKVDVVELTINANEQVVSIKVQNRQMNKITAAQIVNRAQDDKLLTIVDSNGNNAQALYITDATKFVYRGETLKRDQGMTMINQFKNIVVSYSHNNIIILEFVDKYVGELVTLNETDQQVTIKIASGELITVPYTKSNVELKDKPTASLSDLLKGATITLDLEYDQFLIYQIKIHQNIQYEIVSVDSVNKKLKVKTGTQAAFDLSTATIDIFKADGTKGAFSQFKAGDKVNATFVGSTLEKLQSATTTSNG
ncbi:S-layer homology domain-containing protein [Paenibacillus sp. 1011MAR3C5]|uniref:S-layer homology domain-containing protein n=1 Tax=Paenibacillus sp. 1011MAR3C5 TaxID=1675787 RepID=UPI000E6C6BCF|nr:S-layer homology domain-containing protein [Paenibacillus sp. 1011MAR3C5]RJE90103.1 S-layer homology domain-containing protein [Paenibacillus sp. 1011MAR3C5]